MDRQKKMTAAVSAVIAYMQEEQAAIQIQADAAGATAAAPTHGAAPSLWGPSGRQSQMQLRNLMQLRTFNRIR